jgi:hypothetical protein
VAVVVAMAVAGVVAVRVDLERHLDFLFLVGLQSQ